MEDLIKSVGKARALAISIIDMVDNILCKHDIKIPDDDRTGDESEAAIFGTTYALLEDQISDLLRDHLKD